MPAPASRVRLLVAHFFRRFFDNDLVSPDGDGHEHVATVLAAIAAPGLFISIFLALRYLNPLMSPAERVLFSVPDKLLLMSGSMFMMALVTVIEWEALSLDARDYAILGPLPIQHRLLVRAKLMALAMFLAAFAVAINAIPSLAYPIVFMTLMPIGLGRALWLLGTHVGVAFAASAFGFVMVLAVRETLHAVLGPRLFRRLSAPIQFAGVLVLVTGLLLVPAVPSRTILGVLSRAGPVVESWPPMWFVGLNETLSARAILDAPGSDAPSPRGFWTPQRDRAARERYAAYAPLLHRLARRAMTALGVCTAIALLAFLAGTRRIVEPALDVPRPRLWRRLLAAAGRGIARHPVTQAGFFFTLHASVRSAEHRLYLAGYLAAGLGVAIVMLGPSLAHGLTGLAGPPLHAVLPVQMVLSFFLLAGIRAAFGRPAALPANWTFQVCWNGNARSYGRGVRLAVAVLVALLLVLLLPIHLIWLDVRVAAIHLLIGWLAAMIAAELVAIDTKRLPFTYAYVAGRGNLKKWWPLYAAAFSIYTSGVTALERRAYAAPWGGVTLAALLAAALGAAIAWRRLRSRAPVAFDEEPEAVQPLGLTG